MSRPRLASLDAFRGFAIAGMLLVNNPGSWDHVYPQLDHAAWNGCTFTDLIFPFFLVAAGVSLGISLGGRAEGGRGRGRVYGDLLRRAAIIFALGLLLNVIPSFQLGTLRVLGVLQRIALTLALGAPLVLWGGWRSALAGALGLLTAHGVLLLTVPVPGADGVVAAGRLLPGLDLGAWLDRLLLPGHLWARARTWDPEGLLGTLSATASLLSGVLAGHALRLLGARRLWPRFALAGLLLLALGLATQRLGLPINKSLWTPSYALFTSGWALLALALFHGALDEAPAAWRGPARTACLPLTIFGMNALFLYMLAGLLARLLQTAHLASGLTWKGALYQRLAALPIQPVNASLLFAVGFDLVLFGVAWILWRRQWFVKV